MNLELKFKISLKFIIAIGGLITVLHQAGII